MEHAAKKDAHSFKASAKETAVLRHRSESEARLQRWLRFASGRIQAGLSDVPPALQPAASHELQGHAIVFEKVVGWRLPAAALQRVDGPDKSVQLSLSLSLCHLPSKRFFGTQWMGKRCPAVTSADNQVRGCCPILCACAVPRVRA